MSRNKNVFTSTNSDFHEIVNSRDLLREAVEEYLHKMIDTITMGIAMSVHRTLKLKVVDNKEMKSGEEGPRPCVDIFGPYNFKKKYECLCCNCDRIVEASGFAPHLEVCMGMGRSRSRNASRRIANNSKDRDNTTYSAIPSDDEDDMDWSTGDKRKRKKDRIGSKKLKATPKKTVELDPIETINVDVEGESDDMLNLRDLLQDFSRGTSPADSVSSSGSSKRREKTKSKKRKDRSSPNFSLSLN